MLGQIDQLAIYQTELGNLVNPKLLKANKYILVVIALKILI
jgi:ABC-type uncharacterized transport system permease subunit